VGIRPAGSPTSADDRATHRAGHGGSHRNASATEHGGVNAQKAVSAGVQLKSLSGKRNNAGKRQFTSDCGLHRWVWTGPQFALVAQWMVSYREDMSSKDRTVAPL